MIVIIVNPGCKKKNGDNGNGGPDTTSYFTFGQVGNKWVLRIYDNPPGTTCDYSIEITGDQGNGVFNLLYKEGTCSWIIPSYTGYFYLTHLEWREIYDTNPEHGITLLRRDAQVGTIYQYIDPPDTVTVTVLDLNDQVSVTAGQFNCVKVRKEGTIPSASGYPFSAYYWINYKYGLIKVETIFGTWDQELVSVNW